MSAHEPGKILCRVYKFEGSYGGGMLFVPIAYDFVQTEKEAQKWQFVGAYEFQPEFLASLTRRDEGEVYWWEEYYAE